MGSLEKLFTDTARTYHRYLHKVFDSLGLHRGQPRLMFRLWKQDGISQKDLAKELDISPATLTRMVQSLEKTGFISRENDEKDQRITLIYLTPKGRAIREKVTEAFLEIDKFLFDDFDEEEKMQFENLLMKIYNKLKGDSFNETHT